MINCSGEHKEKFREIIYKLNKEGKTAEALAKENKHFEILNLLQTIHNDKYEHLFEEIEKLDLNPCDINKQENNKKKKKKKKKNTNNKISKFITSGNSEESGNENNNIYIQEEKDNLIKNKITENDENSDEFITVKRGRCARNITNTNDKDLRKPIY